MDKTEIQNLIKELIDKTTIVVNNVTITEENPKNVWFSVEVGEPRFFTLHEGEGLSALNHLVRKIIESKDLTPPPPPPRGGGGGGGGGVWSIKRFTKKKGEKNKKKD